VISDRLDRGITQTHLLLKTPEKEKENSDAHVPVEVSDNSDGSAKEGSGSSAAHKRGAAVGRAPTQKIDAETALTAYNEAAATYGFVRCIALTTTRRARLGKRLTYIGGIDAFMRALWQSTSTTFLMGKKPARSGEDPFKLDIDRLPFDQLGHG
jgi:hypothetical protein